MNPASHRPESHPPKPPRLYRLMAVLAGPLERVLGITCRDFTQLASEKLDRPLTPGERRRYFLHRLLCDICRRQERRMQQLNRLAGQSLKRAGEDAAVKLADDARARLRECLAQELKKD